MATIQSKEITFEELKILKIQDRSPLFLPQIKSFDAVIIEYSHQLATKEMIHKIRTHNDEAVYLTPIFIYKVYGEEIDPNPLVDNVLYSLSDLSSVANQVRNIKERMS